MLITGRRPLAVSVANALGLARLFASALATSSRHQPRKWVFATGGSGSSRALGRDDVGDTRSPIARILRMAAGGLSQVLRVCAVRQVLRIGWV